MCAIPKPANNSDPYEDSKFDVNAKVKISVGAANVESNKENVAIENAIKNMQLESFPSAQKSPLRFPSAQKSPLSPCGPQLRSPMQAPLSSILDLFNDEPGSLNRGKSPPPVDPFGHLGVVTPHRLSSLKARPTSNPFEDDDEPGHR